MRALLLALAIVLPALLPACSEQESEAPPAPFALNAEAIGRYCGMNVLEHEGPKGQIILASLPGPIWFSSARDAVAFTMLRDEPKDIAAIYVSDMAVAESWEQPGAENWIDARAAYYVLGSSRRGGMGVAEAVPFSTEKAARAFADAHGGKVARFSDIPQDYVLGDSDGGGDGAGAGAPGAHGTRH